MEAARAGQPYKLVWYERVAVVAAAGGLGMLVLSLLPNWLFMTLLIGAGVVTYRLRGRPYRAVSNAVGRFITGERGNPGHGGASGGPR
jgi:hypothetical protein